MARHPRRASAAKRATYNVDNEWTEADLALLEELKAAEALLPADAPRALLSVRLSVFTDDTTSPVRQELDLRILAREKRCRVVGVASDLNVSATKVAPWKRKTLGDWLNDMAVRALVAELAERKLVPDSTTASTKLRRLRNPGLMGYRVEEDKKGGLRRSTLVLGHDGKPIRIADPIFSEDEFGELQVKLDSRGKDQPTRQTGADPGSSAR